MLSAQATDNSVNKITDKLFLAIKTPEDAIKLGDKKINSYIKTINYHNILDCSYIYLRLKNFGHLFDH